jgi:hypothetical protein
VPTVGPECRHELADHAEAQDAEEPKKDRRTARPRALDPKRPELDAQTADCQSPELTPALDAKGGSKIDPKNERMNADAEMPNSRKGPLETQRPA